MKIDVDNILSFKDVDFCHELDAICPVLSAALKGSLGSIHEDTHEAKVCCTTLYGAIFKIRYATLIIFDWKGLGRIYPSVKYFEWVTEVK